LDDAWLDGPEAQQAIRIMGGLDAALEDPARLFELMGQLREAAEDQPLARWLREHHLTFEELNATLAAVACDNGVPPQERAGERLYSWPMTATARMAVARFDLHGVEPEVIARLFELDGEMVTRYVGWRRRRNPKQDDIMRRHWAGDTVVQISRGLGVAPKVVYDLLDRAGVKPNREQAPTDPSLPRRIVQLRNDGRSYAEIRKATGANTNQIRNALRRAAAQGRVKGYGERVAS
jgi:hypothetical protein